MLVYWSFYSRAISTYSKNFARSGDKEGVALLTVCGFPRIELLIQVIGPFERKIAVHLHHFRINGSIHADMVLTTLLILNTTQGRLLVSFLRTLEDFFGEFYA